MQAPRGTRDILPEVFRDRRALIDLFLAETERFGFAPIATPHFEQRALFTRAVGEETDIIRKEMYDVFYGGEDLGLSLRPENTAGVVRAYIENGMSSWPQPVKLAYAGSMFRHDRPQKGRYREFVQLGVEVLGSADPLTDALLVFLVERYFTKAGLKNLVIKLGSTGDEKCRPDFEVKLAKYFGEYVGVLCEDCQRRLDTNPLRILDCKHGACRKVAAGSPSLLDNLCQECEAHFKQVLEYTETLGLSFEIDPKLVRGLDYYTKTVMEFYADGKNGALALGGGGRYDNLVKLYGGPKTMSVGFSLGLDRIMEALAKKDDLPEKKTGTDVFIVVLGEKAKLKSMGLFKALMAEDISVVIVPDKDSLRSQLKAADSAGATYAVIIGQREAQGNQAILRDMSSGKQETLGLPELPEHLKARLTHVME